jgi:hypothetical protein
MNPQAAAILAARQTLKPLSYGSDDSLHACDWNANMIPADWTKRGVLYRNCGLASPERFAFYALPDGRVAEISYHPMSGPDALNVSVRSAEAQRARWNELLIGEQWEERSDIGYGRIDQRKGRHPKARRVA